MNYAEMTVSEDSKARYLAGHNEIKKGESNYPSTNESQSKTK